ncbi:MAG: 3-hydroxyacyl-ACP dehydratase FabZ family protein [Planctomycetota bacterium]
MKFELIDRVIEAEADRLVAIKAVTIAEEYLQDHFPSFPVLPGVFMLEAMVQAARAQLERSHAAGEPVVLGAVRGLKYGRFVTPGSTVRIEVERLKTEDGVAHFKGSVTLVGEEATAASGRFELRPVRIA